MLAEKVFFSWTDSFEAGVESVGGKGWNLGRLDRYGFNIPPGGVLGANAYAHFIEENELRREMDILSQKISSAQVDEQETEELLTQFRGKIMTSSIPQCIEAELVAGLKSLNIFDRPLAVRSSASAEDSGEASFAGIHESYLNVCGLENIVQAVKDCYASLWTLKAVAYRRKMGISDRAVVPAVVIMQMVEARAAGIAFTCDPKTGREDIVVINANHGLGESIVQGLADPDQYYIDVTSMIPKITDKIIGAKQVITVPAKQGGTLQVEDNTIKKVQALNDDALRRLMFLVIRVYDALGKSQQHQDIEWVFDGRDFVLVQARPVTALPHYTYSELKSQPDYWTNGNFKDAMPMVQSSLSWGFLSKTIEVMLSAPPLRSGYRLMPGVRRAKLINGRIYMNTSVVQWELYDAFGALPRQTNESFGGYQPEIRVSSKNPYLGLRGFRRFLRFMRLLRVVKNTQKNATRYFKEMTDYINTASNEVFDQFSENNIMEFLGEVNKRFSQFDQVVHLINTGAGLIGFLAAFLEKYFPGKGYSIVNMLLMGKCSITSADHGYRLVEIAGIARSDPQAKSFLTKEPFVPLAWLKLPDESPFKQAFKSFLDEYGHRAIYELELMNPRWHEDPIYLLENVRSMYEHTDISKIRAKQKQNSEKAWGEINKKIPFYMYPLVKWMVLRAGRGSELREMAKSVAVREFDFIRRFALEMGHRFAEKGILAQSEDIFDCTWAECFSILAGYWDGRELKILVTERKQFRLEMESLSPPDLVVGRLPKYSEPAKHIKGNTLIGIGVASGQVSGRARLVSSPNEGLCLQNGDILVAPSTDPAWTPLFLKASGIVMETGSYLSHGVIVAREYGIPAVVNVPGVMKIVKDCQKIAVDGDEGKVILQ